MAGPQTPRPISYTEAGARQAASRQIEQLDTSFGGYGGGLGVGVSVGVGVGGVNQSVGIASIGGNYGSSRSTNGGNGSGRGAASSGVGVITITGGCAGEVNGEGHGSGVSTSAGSLNIGSAGSVCTQSANNSSAGRTACRPSSSSNESVVVPESHVEIIVDANKCNKSKDVEQGSKRVRRKHRPLYRRFINYVRNAISGVHFSTSPDSEYEDIETPPRYRPDSLSALCRATRFSEDEIKRIYRGFKAECPTGVVKEDTFKIIYAQFFPQGGSCANTGLYAHYVFNTLDQDNSGIVSFEEFVQGLSILSRGSVEEKLQWTFSLYDINGDGIITREEMTDIVTAIYELMGRLPDTCPDEAKIKDKVERIFQKMDVNRDGVVTLEEFLECCRNDEAISRSMTVFDTAF